MSEGGIESVLVLVLYTLVNLYVMVTPLMKI